MSSHFSSTRACSSEGRGLSRPATALRWSSAKERRCRRAPAGELLFCCVAAWCMVLGIAGRGSPAETSPLENGYWRRPTNDGLVCLFLVTALLGDNTPFETFWQESVADKAGVQDMASLASLIRSSEWRLRIRRLSYQEAVQSRLPLILHVEPYGPETGGFLVLCSAGPESAQVFEGASARLRTMSTDELKQVWNGYAIVPEARTPTSAIITRVVSLCLVTFAACGMILVLRGRRH